MAINGFWEIPIMGWSFDDLQSIRSSVFTPIEFDAAMSNYRVSYNDNQIGLMIFDLPINFNLGGKEEKTRLVTTDRPLGVFDFSLASKGLYRVPEYFSQELADTKPRIFKELNLAKGVVPPNFVVSTKINGKPFFTFTDIDGITYNLTQQQKGTADIEQNVKGAKKQFATTTKKVYLKFNRQGGKVKYIELYSLFYFTRDGNDVDYALCHLPALQVAEYFESRGIGVRFYMTRFVVMSKGVVTLREYDLRSNSELPLYKESLKKNKLKVPKYVLFQPIQVKDFYQEINMSEALSISSLSESGVLYNTIAKNSLEQEIIDGNDIDPYGNPDWQQIQYLEAFERYRNKYSIYTKQGIWKSKEVTPEGQMFFHSMSLKYYLSDFIRNIKNSNLNNPLVVNKNFTTRTPFYEFISVDFVGQKFFEFWMKICGFRLKHIILLQITQNIRKDLQLCINESKEQIDSMVYYLNSEVGKKNETAVFILRDYIYRILEMESYPIMQNNEINYKGYIVNILQDSQVYAEKGYFPTPLDDIEKRDLRVLDILNELNNL